MRSFSSTRKFQLIDIYHGTDHRPLHSYFALVEGEKWRGPAEDPLGILGCDVDTTMRALDSKIVVPEYAMDRRTRRGIEKGRPGNRHRIIAGIGLP